MRAWIDGHLLPDPTAPAVRITDHGFTVGDGVFEAIKVVDGLPFALTRHLERLARSAAGLGLPELDQDAVRRGVAAVLEGQDLPLGPDPDHLHRGTGAARLRTRRRAADAGRGRRRDGAVAGDDRGRDGAVAAQRARRARRPQDHVVRRERRRAGRRPAERGASEAVFANLAGPPVRGHRLQRVLRRRRRAAHAHAGERLPGRGHPRAGPGVVRRRRGRRADRGGRAGRARCS